MELNLSAQQKQTLNQQMQLSVQILQMNRLELAQYIQNMALENPMIDLEAPSEPEDESPVAAHLKELEWLRASNERSASPREYSGSRTERNPPVYEEKKSERLRDFLLQQLPTVHMSPQLNGVIRYLIDSLDEKGYLTLNEDDLQVALGQHMALFPIGLAVLQQMEPLGVGARNLQECLLIQAGRLPDPSPLLVPLIENHLELLARNQLSKLSQVLGVPLDEVKEARLQLTALNPKPGNGFSQDEAIPYLRPDLFVLFLDGAYQILYNDYHGPRIQINQSYLPLAQGEDAEAASYVKDCLHKAQWLSSCIQQRKHTILRCGEQILMRQEGFFREGPGHTAPMALSDIAASLELHPSTISRAVNGKYLQCQWGVFPLRSFFSRSIGENENKKSQDMVADQIRQMIAAEDKRRPYSDQHIADALGEKSISLARRTVAKYREALGIPAASKRKSY